ncbi:cobalt-precorrin-6A reductase [Chelatococcus sp. GCM10030263]|uniref:cobalt-precorrin-6A reductase n=1 Tax=Chelatococcus sp. GCM10030263 TaxID=3273387 RepID=UPI003613ADD8
MALKLLLLGGTTEASRLAALLAGRPDVAPILSLAGRTRDLAPSPIPRRIGGFGGVDGLIRFLQNEGIAAVVDATHPFAAQISANATKACTALDLPLARLTRPAWTSQAGDRWQEVASAEAAAAALGEAPKRVFLTVGRLSLHAFAAVPQHHYLVRTIDAPDGLALNVTLIQARGPFSADAEEVLMRREGIEILVTKNSGGEATAGKLVAARHLGLPVIMVARPDKPAVPTFYAPEEVMGWLETAAASNLPLEGGGRSA